MKSVGDWDTAESELHTNASKRCLVSFAKADNLNLITFDSDATLNLTTCASERDPRT
jgi:hypothetical protein